ncbi:DUF1613-domain-containing protein [Suhomyces tanzawaensis NRRL Y-17324]|uniref:tRNA (uracil-O(2)-)-methyltransferase n=1 Tax=Suhomyces tanzawaensis NRRL Y-17324 TaxID=984487 RepID=A0A1E4SMX6_9ASCO|nr:DUF1613-domain-containing protein [Suhomyces tanzawaensis NRRL Y-17324]ODV80879.1 DUF1613-domain-containing protein [Suhomyces tanzawaensis NRRL Y-17324]
MKGKEKKLPEAKLIISDVSVLGDPWVPIYETQVDFEAQHFEAAMSNLIKQPNINSTVIMRADILRENKYDPEEGVTKFESKFVDQMPEFPKTDNQEDVVLHRYLEDISLKSIPLNSEIKLNPKSEIIRRIIPRNPFKDYIINQTCLLLRDEQHQENGSVLVVYIPHIKTSDETPFYLPPVYAVGILYHQSTLSIHYLPFGYNTTSPENLRELDPAERPIRIALRLLQTSAKHSHGAKTGYEKRVNHDLVVPKIAFQNRYISLKKKYSSDLVNLWSESTDPKKHVFEDLAIAAFLIEFWNIKYNGKTDFEFRDLGCGNGLLVYILQMEGYKGKGIDARARKSWATYPKEVQDNLYEQIVIPGILLKPHPAVSKLAPQVKDNGRVFNVPMAPNDKGMEYHSSGSLLNSNQVCTTEDFPSNTFIIGNHSDELTCWIPLLGFPFIVIPCCSHALSGAKIRYPPRKAIHNTNIGPNHNTSISTYSTLVDHVEDLARQVGWKVEKEMLRIPSTRNSAIIGTDKIDRFKNESKESTQVRLFDILAVEGGAEGWVENSMLLMKKAPRNH